MENVTEALQTDNGWIIAILIAIIVILLIIGARHGLVKIKTDKIQVGRDASNQTQKIIKHQEDWVKIAVSAFEQKIPKFDDYDEWRGKFLIEKCLNVINDWIVQNHIETTKNYIELKQEMIWNLLLTHTEKDELRSTKFKKEVYAYVEYIIRNLVRIRKQYEDEE